MICRHSARLSHYQPITRYLSTAVKKSLEGSFYRLQHFLQDDVRTEAQFYERFVPLVARTDFSVSKENSEAIVYNGDLSVNDLLYNETVGHKSSHIFFTLLDTRANERQKLKSQIGYTQEHASSAVILPIFFRNGYVHVVLLRKTSLYKNRDASYRHAGQPSLPGGKIYPVDDNSLEKAALRECIEETGLTCDIINRTLPLVHTFTLPKSSTVKPFIGLVTSDIANAKIQDNEIDYLFEVPLIDVLRSFNLRGRYPASKLSSHQIVEYNGFVWELRNIYASLNSPAISKLEYTYNGESLDSLLVWGMTARLLSYTLGRLDVALELEDYYSKEFLNSKL